MTFTVREATIADADAVAAISREARATAMPWLPVLHTPEEDAAFFHATIERENTWLAVLEHVPIGFISVEGQSVDHLYIDPAHQGQGAGSALLELAQGLGTPMLRLWVFRDNTRARDFYAMHGFTEVEFTEGAGNEEHTPDVRLEWHRLASSS